MGFSGAYGDARLAPALAKREASHHFDLTPDPRVLVALTHTPLQPLDALCELVDNAIDSFTAAADDGKPVEHPLAVVELPGQAEVGRGAGLVRVRDNGRGLTAEHAEKAMRAGFSGNNPFDSLGLFGMGFNIATGKLGRTTTLITAQEEDDDALQVRVDLLEMQESGSYRVPTERIPKPPHFTHGTIVEVTDWWPEGNPNNGFIKKLAGYSKPTIREELSRRYATLLRDRGIRITVNGEPCEAFEHCVWGRDRYVERKGHGQIPAVFDFNELLGSQTRCSDCNALVSGRAKKCENCGSSSFRTLEERLQGWVGIQRFDDQTRFGVDLIRNGRAIRIGEQGAFFTYTDELKRSLKDYPIDSQYGRIVGEVHMNHVPVDFLKQDFQRSSPEWLGAMAFLRGESSLQPNQPGADQNTSPIFKLYQGYRKVRNPGKRDMYMGYWDTTADKPKRISRDVEAEYYEKFLARMPGYYDDAEWWKLVEKADEKPLDELITCPNCGAENLAGTEECQACGEIIDGKDCSKCGAVIPKSAVSCPQCGTSQIPEIKDPWTCQICGEINQADEEKCGQCASTRGLPPPASLEALLADSDKDDELSIPGCSVQLADGTKSQPLDVDVYVARSPIRPVWGGPEIPLVSFKGPRIEVFVHQGHPVFKLYRSRPNELIAAEVAQYLYDANRRLVADDGQRPLHSVSNLMTEIIRDRWGEELQESPDRVRDEIRSLFDTARDALASEAGERGADLYGELTEEQVKSLVSTLLDRGEDAGRVAELSNTGGYLQFVDDDTLVDLFRMAPELFFDGQVWDVKFSEVDHLEPGVLEEMQFQIAASYRNALEDCAAFMRARNPDSLVTHRAASSLELLARKLAA